MSKLCKISPYEISVKPTEDIGHNSMLVSVALDHGEACGTDYNMMTASWGGIGELWGRPVAFVFIRPERYTYEFAEKSKYMSLTFFGDERRDTMRICGTKSGRNTDKEKLCSLSPVFVPYDDGRAVYFDDAKAVLILKKMYAAPLELACALDKALLRYYTEDGVHKMYVCEIIDALEAR